MAFELHAKANAQNTKRERLLQLHQEKILQTYAAGTAKPWPADLPGVKQRSIYDQMKSAALQQLSQPAQAAMLQGHTAPRVVGERAARQLRAALMARCQQVIPLIQEGVAAVERRSRSMASSLWSLYGAATFAAA